MMKRVNYKGKTFFTLILVLSCFMVKAKQSEKIDSLYLKLNKSEGKERVNILNDLSFLTLSVDVNKSGHLARVALDVAEEAGYGEGMAIAQNNMADYYSFANKADSAIIFYKKAVTWFEENNKQDKISNIYNAMGIAATRIGNYSDGLDFVIKGLVINQQINDSVKIGDSYCSLGKVMERLGEPAQALENYEKSYTYLKSGKNLNLLAKTLMNIGVVNFTLGNYKESSNFYNRAIVIQEQNNDNYGLMATYMHLGKLNSQNGDNNAAIIFHNMAKEKATSLNNLHALSEIYIHLGEIYSNDRKKQKQGLEYLEKGLKFAKKTKNKRLEKNAYQALAECYSQMKEHDLAYSTQKLYSTLNDSLVKVYALAQVEKSKPLLELQQKTIADKEAEIAMITVEKEKLNKRINFVTLISVISITVLLIFYRRKKSRY